MAVEYFIGIFIRGGNVIPQQINHVSRVISDTQNANFTRDLEFDEFTKSIKQMHLDKSSGPDGFSQAFFSAFLGTPWQKDF